MVLIRYWWPGYAPESALSSFKPHDRKTEFEVSEDAGLTWRYPRPGATLESVCEWMIDRDYVVRNIALAGDRRNGGGWEGRYVLTLGPKKKGGV